MLHAIIVKVYPFRIDKDRSGAISASELQQALSNGKHRKHGKIVVYFSVKICLPLCCVIAEV
jgi:hypothetical protein